MAIVKHYTDEQRRNIAVRIGTLFDLPDAGMKMTREGWQMDHPEPQDEAESESHAIPVYRACGHPVDRENGEGS